MVARVKTLFTNQFSNNSFPFVFKKVGKNKHVIQWPRSVRIGKNCALDPKYGPRPCTEDLGHSFSLYGPTEELTKITTGMCSTPLQYLVVAVDKKAQLQCKTQ